MKLITGNLSSVHAITGRDDLVVLAVSAGAFGGTFNTTAGKVTLDGNAATTVADVVNFVVFRSHVAARLHDVSEDGSLGMREVGSVELVQVESPVVPSHSQGTTSVG
jgi:hypothetical protein